MTAAKEIVPLQHIQVTVHERCDRRGSRHVAKESDLAEVVACICSRPQTLRSDLERLEDAFRDERRRVLAHP